MREVLVPQFTIRRLFIVVTACGLFCVVLMMAARGLPAARSVVATIGLLGVCFGACAVIYVVGLILNQIRPAPQRGEESPFAQHSMPPSYVVPKDE